MPQVLAAAACVLALSACGASPMPGALALTSVGAQPSGVARRKQFLPPPWSNGVVMHAPPLAPEPLESERSDPPMSAAGQRVVETAERMVGEGTVVRGSCYRYIDTVFDTAGYSGSRQRSTVFRGSRNGPYADLDLIEPGDWLWIVNHPELTPVGTHSVLFLGWADRSAGYANVVSYVGGMEDRPGDMTTYDVTRTYAIHRAVDTRTARRR